MDPATSPDQLPRTTSKIKWGVVAGIVFFHVGALFAFWTFNWSAFWVCVLFQWITGGLGITLGFHRLLTHRSFRVPKWLEYVFTLCGSIAFQGGPTRWVSTHRVHHAFSDRPQDPHSPNRGFWWAHMMWLFAYDEVLDSPTKHLRYVPDLAKDAGHVLIQKTQVLQFLVLSGLMYAWGGWPFVIWGVFVRTVLVYHCTWFVNSAAHMWGYQTYQTNEGSRNNWWVAILTYGEGWHNNHHAYPYSARHGLRWWEFDMTWLTIKLLALVGLADNIRLPRGNPAQLPVPQPTRPPLIAPRMPVPMAESIS